MASRTAIGLDIGATAVRAAQLKTSRQPYVLERFGQVPLPPGAVRDGEVVNPDAVSAALRQLWAQAKFASKRVILGVANQRVVVRQVDLPWVPVGELRESLAFQAQDFIPMPVSEAVLDCHPVGEFHDDAGMRRVRVLLVAAARPMLDNLLLAVDKAGLEPVMVDLTPFALVRALADQGNVVGGPEALIDVGADVTNIVVHENGVPRFVRILMMGGSDVTEALAERLGVPPEQAEALKQRSVGMAGAAALPEPAARAMEAAINRLVDEVRNSMDYYLAQAGATRMTRMVVTGGGGLLTEFAQRLSAQLRLPAQMGSPLGAVRVGRGGSTDAGFSDTLMATPLGLAMAVA